MSEFNRYFDSINAKAVKNYLIAFAVGSLIIQEPNVL